MFAVAKLAYGTCYVIYFPTYFAGFTNMSPHYILSPALKIAETVIAPRSARRKDYRLCIDNDVTGLTSADELELVSFDHFVLMAEVSAVVAKTDEETSADPVNLVVSCTTCSELSSS